MRFKVSPFVSAFEFLRFAKQGEKVDTCGLEVSTFLTLVSAFECLRFAKQGEKVDTCGLEVSTFLTLPV